VWEENTLQINHRSKNKLTQAYFKGQLQSAMRKMLLVLE